MTQTQLEIERQERMIDAMTDLAGQLRCLNERLPELIVELAAVPFVVQTPPEEPEPVAEPPLTVADLEARLLPELEKQLASAEKSGKRQRKVLGPRASARATQLSLHIYIDGEPAFVIPRRGADRGSVYRARVNDRKQPVANKTKYLANLKAVSGEMLVRHLGW